MRDDMGEWERARRSYRVEYRPWPEPPRSFLEEIGEVVIAIIAVAFGILVAVFGVIFTMVALLFSILVALAPYVVALAAMLWLMGLL